MLQAASVALFRHLAARRENSFLRKLRCSASGAGSRYVAYIGTAGLANRLRAHVIASAYAERTGRTLVPCWVSNKHLGCVYSDLFDSGALERIHFDTVRRVGYRKNVAAVQGDGSDYPDDLVFFKTQWQDVNSEYLLHASRPDCANFQKWFRPRAEVSLLVERTVKQWPRNVLGVHVRRGDFVTHTRQAIPQSRYIAAMERVLAEMPDRGSIFLASDASAEELQCIRDAFPGRIARNVKKPELFEGARGSLAGARGAMVDMLLLSRCSRLILTPGSTFGEFAAQVGGTPFSYA